MKNIKIISDGTIAGTHVILEETGEEIYVRGIEWKLEADYRGNRGLATVVLTVDAVPVEVRGVLAATIEEP